ncbi:MAG: 4Fe-4S dicluster domain-containing protein [Desulfobacteraceae bacterium]|nr:MAG: 4Fe-4S dicluster domain-containing protein [Desulfobacteraceae bacterium]
MKIMSIKHLETVRRQYSKRLYDPEATEVKIGMASCGIAAGGKAAFEKAIKEFPGDNGVKISPTGCLGFCEKEPLIEIAAKNRPRLVYQNATDDKIIAIINAYRNGDFTNRKWILGQVRDPRGVMEDIANPLAGIQPLGDVPFLEEIPFFKDQMKIALRNCGYIDPDRIEEYMARGGYASFLHVLHHMAPAEIIRIVKNSGLRGRGGGGFPTGAKWETCAAHSGERYVICNADEGDPGAYMDRSILEGDPHSVIEGMLIAALAIGSGQGYIYVRKEYPLAVKRLKTAIGQAEAFGLLGDRIAGSAFGFKIKISTGAGAFVCGESTALMASLEGTVGRPRAKYIHTVEKGFRGSPSNLNNVETYACVPVILHKGADWFASMGTEGSKGTKVFSLVGKVKHTGLVEVPMGMSLRDIVFKIGGGVVKGKTLKAVQTGGPSGGCIPEKLLDLPVDYQKLAQVGSIMGSGGMIVMDRDTCMVDIARYFLDFLKEESCGQCIPCREGIKQMLDILNNICQGNGKESDIALLEELAGMVKDASLCGLGTSAPNPVLTTISYFRDEYEAHIRDKKCPAGVCKALFHYEIDPQACNGCRLCFLKCPQQAVAGEKKQPHEVNQEKCIKCGICYEACKFDAVVIK